MDMAAMRESGLENIKCDIRDSFCESMINNWPEEIEVGAKGDDELRIRGRKYCYLSRALDMIFLDELPWIRCGGASLSSDDSAQKEAEEQEDRNLGVIWKRFDAFSRKYLKDKFDPGESFINKFVFSCELPYLAYYYRNQYL